METTEDKLLQIVLVGQPELDESWIRSGLDSSSRGLRFARDLIRWMRNETKGYIERRLQIAGTSSQAETLFPEETIAAVHCHSRGFPRLINTICENALITAYARQMPSVTPEIVEDVAKEFRLDVVVRLRSETSREP